MENIDVTATLELIAAIAIVVGFAATFFKKTKATPTETVEEAPYKVETPVAPVVEETPAPVVTEAPKTRARKDAGEKKPATKKAPAKKTAKKKITSA